MPYKPVPEHLFNGLRLDRETDEVGPDAAIDGLNFELDRKGGVRSRDGYAKLTASAGSTRYDSVGPIAAGVASAQAGPSAPATAADDSSFGTLAWSNPTFAEGSDFAYATIGPKPTPTFANTHYLKLTNFGFALPVGATVLGVVVEAQRGFQPSQIPNQGREVFDIVIKLVKGGVVSGTNKSAGAIWPNTEPSGPTAAWKKYGSATDLWGLALSRADVNASNFGVVFSGSINLNYFSEQVTLFFNAARITVYYTAANTALVLAASATARIDAINSDGSVATTVATATDQQASYANFGSPAASATYIAVGSGSTIRKYAAATFTAPAGMPKARYVALQSPDNRLVAASISTIPTGAGSTASTSLVHFSGAGTPEVWGANDYEYVTPGDGEDIQGIVAWRELVFVFKSTKFFVFYGNDTDPSTSTSIFNYRPVTTGTGLCAPLALAPSPLGLFFMDRRGIYLTNGADPRRVSGPIDPLFLGGASSFFIPGIINSTALSQASMCWYNDRLYVGVALGTASTNSHTLVYDPSLAEWTIWDIPMGALCSIGTIPTQLLFTYATGTNDIGQYAPNAYTDDAGNSIFWRYRSGFYTVGNAPSQEVEIRETPIEGIGTVTFSLSRDFQDVPTGGGGAQQTVVMAPTTAQGRHRVAQRGRRFSYQIEGSTAATVDGFVHHIREIRPGGEQTD